jgi:hypothetical protein
MTRLARAFTALAVDLGGIGGSTPSPGRYDAQRSRKTFTSWRAISRWRSPISPATIMGAWSPTRWLASIRRRRGA